MRWLMSVFFAALLLAACMVFGFAVGATLLLFDVAYSLGHGDPLPTSSGIAAMIIYPGIAFALAYVPVIIFTAFKGSSLVLRHARAKHVDPLALQTAQNVVAEVAIAAGIRAPALALVDSPLMNVMAVGSGPKHATVAMTTGLVRRLSRDELQAASAFAVARIVSGDLQFTTFLAAQASLFATLEDRIMGMTPTLGRFNTLMVLLPATALSEWLIDLSRLAASRQRAFVADDVAVLLTRDPEAVVSALRRLSRQHAGWLDRKALAPVCMVDSAWPMGDSRWRSAHPSSDARLERLSMRFAPSQSGRSAGREE